MGAYCAGVGAYCPYPGGENADGDATDEPLGDTVAEGVNSCTMSLWGWKWTLRGSATAAAAGNPAAAAAPPAVAAAPPAAVVAAAGESCGGTAAP